MSPMRSDQYLGFVYESSEFIGNHSADFAVLKWTGHMMGHLPRDYENQINGNVKSILVASLIFKLPPKRGKVFWMEGVSV